MTRARFIESQIILKKSEVEAAVAQRVRKRQQRGRLVHLGAQICRRYVPRAYTFAGTRGRATGRPTYASTLAQSASPEADDEGE